MQQDYTEEQIRAEFKRLSTIGIDIHELYGFCPVQSTGLIDKRPFYFRARWGSWSIGVAAEGQSVDDAVDAQMLVNPPVGCWSHEQPYGDSEYAAGYMPLREAIAFIEQSASLLRAGS